ncbi:hypothetical protein ACVWWP_000371 [Bradyrhizobium sp. LM3.6]
MELSRRMILQGAGSLPFAIASLRAGALAQTAPAAPSEVPPILFVHGNGEYDALWMTTMWRMESNGIARDRMQAINFTDPNARSDDKVEQAGRSSTEDQRRELAAAIAELKRRTGASRVALVGSSRGGYAIRNVIKNGGAGDVQPCRAVRHAQSRRVRDRRPAQQRVQRPRRIPARPERWRERGDAGCCLSHIAQRRHGQIRAGRWPLHRQAGHANWRHR